MSENKLFLFVLGGKPPGRNVEQHDVFFSAGNSIEECAPNIKKYWDIPGVHIDTYMIVEQVGEGYRRIARSASAPKVIFYKLWRLPG